MPWHLAKRSTNLPSSNSSGAREHYCPYLETYPKSTYQNNNSNATCILLIIYIQMSRPVVHLNQIARDPPTSKIAGIDSDCITMIWPILMTKMPCLYIFTVNIIAPAKIPLLHSTQYSSIVHNKCHTVSHPGVPMFVRPPRATMEAYFSMAGLNIVVLWWHAFGTAEHRNDQGFCRWWGCCHRWAQLWFWGNNFFLANTQMTLDRKKCRGNIL